jgi:hypothetical protein
MGNKTRLKTKEEVKAALKKYTTHQLLDYHYVSYALMNQLLLDDHKERMLATDRQLTMKEVGIYLYAPILWPRKKPKKG